MPSPSFHGEPLGLLLIFRDAGSICQHGSPDAIGSANCEGLVLVLNEEFDPDLQGLHHSSE